MVTAVLSLSGFCYHDKYCMSFFERFDPWNLVNYIFFTLPLLFFSLLTYRMRNEAFRAWWNLARWWMPVVIVTTIFVEYAARDCSMFCNLGHIFILGPLYIVFILSSLWQIVRTNRRLEK